MEKERFLSSDAKLLETGLFSDVTVRCQDREWNLHKAILCTRSEWFEKALNGKFQEAQTGIVKIEDFEPEAVNWVVRYIYTGACHIPSLKGKSTRKTNFVTSIEVYTVADFFQLAPLVKIALDTLSAEFDAKLPAIQIEQKPAGDWLPEFFEAIGLIYADTPLCGTTMTPMTPIRTAFVAFAHAARFYFLQNTAFTKFLDEEAPVFALDMFRAMRNTGDFVAHAPEPCCSYCKTRPGRCEKAYYTHIGPDTLKLQAACSNCAAKKDFASGMQNWMGKQAYGRSPMT
ncbi:BTB/POZ protein [Podospora australis]|uniref:BTB/POZ protein n=1 Tax=Podospora australis TaxID=1536484 RepID=A0AAN6WIT0_9PEZI|nr:BTB/POZ protein [Podospora australis]